MLKQLKFIKAMYSLQKQNVQPDLKAWEFCFQMLVSVYLSSSWLDNRFEFWNPQYWAGLSQYSSLSELSVRAKLASDRIQSQHGAAIIDQMHRRNKTGPYSVVGGDT